MDTEKKTIANDMAKRGWRAVLHTGTSTGFTQPRSRFGQEGATGTAAGTRACAPVVAARILFTRLGGGSTCRTAFNQLRPVSAWANRGPQTGHISRCCRK